MSGKTMLSSNLHECVDRIHQIQLIFPLLRHISKDKNKKISILRFGFHTGYVIPENSRFKRSQIDGAVKDARFPKNFFLDLIFRSSLDETGKEVQGALPEGYWENVIRYVSVLFAE